MSRRGNMFRFRMLFLIAGIIGALVSVTEVFADIEVQATTVTPPTLGGASDITIGFDTDAPLVANQEGITIWFPSGFVLPATINRNSIFITTENGLISLPAADPVVNPAARTVTVIISDTDPIKPLSQSLAAAIDGAPHHSITFAAAAGIRNPRDPGCYRFKLSSNREPAGVDAGRELLCFSGLSLSPVSGAVGTLLTAIGLGYAPNSTVTVWVDNGAGDGNADDAIQNGAEPTLAQVITGSDSAVTVKFIASVFVAGAEQFTPAASPLQVNARDAAGNAVPAAANPTFTVEVSPRLTLLVTSLEFGTTELTKAFAIINTGGGTLDWQLTGDQPWPSVSPANGTTTTETDIVTVTVSRSGLAPGTHQGTITVTSNGGNRTITVSMAVPTITAPTVVPQQPAPDGGNNTIVILMSVIGGAVLSAGGGLKVLRTVRNQGWEKKAEQSERQEPCTPGSRYCRMVKPKLEQASRKVEHLMIAAAAVGLVEGRRAFRLKGKLVERLNGEIKTRREIGRVDEASLPTLADTLVTEVVGQLRSTVYPRDIVIEVRVVGSRAKTSFVLYRCKNNRWEKEREWNVTIRDAANQHVAQLLATDPADGASRSRMVAQLRLALTQFIEQW